MANEKTKLTAAEPNGDTFRRERDYMVKREDAPPMPTVTTSYWPPTASDEDCPFYKSGQIDQLLGALCKAQLEIDNPIKNAENPHFRSHYSTLDATLNANLKKVLHKHDLVVMQTTDYHDGRTLIVSTLLHTSGQWISGVLEATPLKPDPQSLMSAITYSRRYALLGLLGLASQEDDDGTAASDGAISAAQANRLYAIAKKNGWTQDQILEAVQASGSDSVETIHYQKYQKACDFFGSHRPGDPKSPKN